jgi:hypothetical protein
MDPGWDPLEERFKDIERKKATHQTGDSLFAILVISIQSDFEVSIIIFQTLVGMRRADSECDIEQRCAKTS